MKAQGGCVAEAAQHPAAEAGPVGLARVLDESQPVRAGRLSKFARITGTAPQVHGLDGLRPARGLCGQIVHVHTDAVAYPLKLDRFAVSQRSGT